MATGYLLVGFVSISLITLLALLAVEGSSEPWQPRDTWFVCILFIWLVALPTSLLISFSYAKRKRGGLYAGTLLLSFAAAAHLAFVRYVLLSSQPSPQYITLISLFSFAGWLVTLYLITVVWSKVRCAKGSVS
jgi:CDP-diglyceride synthetase